MSRFKLPGILEWSEKGTSKAYNIGFAESLSFVKFDRTKYLTAFDKSRSLGPINSNKNISYG